MWGLSSEEPVHWCNHATEAISNNPLAHSVLLLAPPVSYSVFPREVVILLFELVKGETVEEYGFDLFRSHC